MRGKAKRVARPAQMRLQNSWVTRPKFTKFLSDTEESLASFLAFTVLSTMQSESTAIVPT